MVAAITIRADEPRCSASARECDEQIRKFLAGRRYLGATIDDHHPGLFIKSVAIDGPAERAGLRPGDRLIAVNGKSVTQATTREVKQILADARETGRLFIILSRHGSYSSIEARLEPYSKAQLDKIVAAHLAQSHSSASGAQH
jgi:membrane-associated protease RseP (regulator of RpoE activity)